MSIIIEGGTGKSDAESFISVETASAYFTARGVTTWDALDEGEATVNREAALRKATDYLTAVYRGRWEGVRYTETQALDWPRAGVVRDSWSVDTDEIPVEVQNAEAELALKSAMATLLDDQTQAVVKERVGVIEVEYNPNSPATTRYKQIESMLRPYLNGVAGCNVPLVRA